MPRTARLNVLDVVHNVMARGLEGLPLFRDDRDREEFIRRLGEVVAWGGAQLLAWSLMPSHFHLVLRPREVHLTDLMRRLLTGYARWHNRRHGRRGPLFRSRYRSVVVEEEPYLRQLVRYVHLNPVRAGLSRSIDGLDDFPWAGHGVLLGRHEYPPQDVGAVLERFGGTFEEARSRYRAFVVSGFEEGRREEFRGGGRVRSAGGWGVLKLRKTADRAVGDPRMLGSGAFVAQVLGAEGEARTGVSTTAHEVLAAVAGKWGLDPRELLGPSRARRLSAARREFYVRAHGEAGLTVADLARLVGRTPPAVRQAMAREFREDPSESR